MLVRTLALFLLSLIFGGCDLFSFADHVVPKVTKKEDFIAQIKRVECENSERFSAVQRLLTNLGVEDSDVEIEKFENVTNIVLTVKGKTDETVVVGAHFDKTTLGCGAIDNWTGIVLVANLYKEFVARKNNKTYKFVAFGKEEKGLIGSKAMAGEIPDSEISNYCGMVNFDSFGFTDVWTLRSISDRKMIQLAEEVALDQGFTLESKSFAGASSDSKSFRNKGIPAITFSGLSDDWRDFLHQDKDQLEHIDFKKVWENFTFSYEYLSVIDNKICGSSI